MLRGPWWAKTGQVFLYALISTGLLVGATGCGTSVEYRETHEKPRTPYNWNHDPREGWVYVDHHGRPDYGYNFTYDLKYRCVKSNLVIVNENGGAPDQTDVVGDAKECA